MGTGSWASLSPRLWGPSSPSWESFELEGTIKAIWTNFAAVNRDTYSYIRLLRAPSSLTLSVSRDGAFITFVGYLCQCLTTPIIKIFSLCPT